LWQQDAPEYERPDAMNLSGIVRPNLSGCAQISEDLKAKFEILPIPVLELTLIFDLIGLIGCAMKIAIHQDV
jgi:hypothetical protein